ncbi:MAG: RNA polymerase sigma factor [Thermoleophilia bacterium]|nr:RNA polymerase sigma factor [Thermoleophilia bacterium]
MEPVASRARRLVNSLYLGHYSKLVRYADRVGESRASAEDAVQEAFLRLFRYLLQGGDIEDPIAWLLAVIRRNIVRACQREARQRALYMEMTREFGEDGGQSEAGGPHWARAGELGKLFASLSGRQRQVLLRLKQGYTYREIASDLGVSTNTIKTLRARALHKMRAGTSSLSRPGSEGKSRDADALPVF